MDHDTNTDPKVVLRPAVGEEIGRILVCAEEYRIVIDLKCPNIDPRMDLIIQSSAEHHREIVFRARKIGTVERLDLED